MSYPSALIRTKNWGNEVWTDTDIEGQLDLINNWIMAAMDDAAGHNHSSTNGGAPINLTASVTGILPVANLPVGTSANELLQLDANGKIPIVDASQVTGIPITISQAIGSNDINTTSTTYVDMTGMSITLTAASVNDKFLMMFSAPIMGSNSSTITTVAFDVDGSQYSAAPIVISGTTVVQFLSRQYMITGLAAGAHTFKVVYKSNNGTYQAQQRGSTDGARIFTITTTPY